MACTEPRYAMSMMADVALSVKCYRYFAGWADKNHGKVRPPIPRLGMTYHTRPSPDLHLTFICLSPVLHMTFT